MTDRDRSLLARDGACVWHPNTQHATEAPPLAVARASGATIELEDGTRLIDAISSWWTILHGHGHPRLARAMRDQVERLDHVLFAGATHEPAVRLAERLVELSPPGLTRVYYSDNGSTAVEIALKMAYQRFVQRGEPERRVFVSLAGGYHGDTFGTMSVGDPDPFFLPFAPMLFETRRVAVDAQAVHAALAALGPRAAGVVLEPLVQGAAGMRIHTPQFLRDVRAACDTFGVPLIADEVFTGFGRTGHLFACAAAQVTPDLMCLSKGLTGGTFPLAATLATEEIFEAFLSDRRELGFFHAHTFTGHPVGCALAVESLDLVLEGDVPAALTAAGDAIFAGLEPLRDQPRVSGLRHIGGIVAYDLEPPSGDAAGYYSALAPRLRAAAIERGVLLRPLGNVIYAVPPACVTDAECARIAEVMVELASLS